MAFLRSLGSYLPARAVDNAELAPMVGADPEWLLRSTGIEERRFAGPEESGRHAGYRGSARLSRRNSRQ